MPLPRAEPRLRQGTERADDREVSSETQDGRDAPLIDQAADRLIVELGRRIRHGRLTVEMPNGARRTFVGTHAGPVGRDPDPRP